MQNIKIMFKSSRFVIGLCLVLIVVIYAVLYPIVNPADPKDNRRLNPLYPEVAELNQDLNRGDSEAALAEAYRLMESDDPVVAEAAGQVYQGILRTVIDRALSGAKQIKGSKYPLKAEADALREMLTIPEDADEAQILAAEEAARAEIARLTAHGEAVRAADGGDITSIEDPDVRAEFEALAGEDPTAEAETLVAGHEANEAQYAVILSRLDGEDLDFSDAKKLLAGAVPQSYLIDKDQPPSPQHPLGTDMFSRDVLLEMAHGARVSLLVGLIAGVLATIIGILIGLFAGFRGGWLDNVLSTCTNLFLVIPSYIILILISVAMGQIREAWITGMVIGFTAWPWTAKSVRAQTTSLRNRDHVNMARITGYGTFRIILSEILPYIASYVVMAFILQVASGIMSEATLAILGLGDPTAISLGRMISWAQQYESIVNGRWWEFVPVAVCITMITFGLYMMNSGMDQVFNPKIRS